MGNVKVQINKEEMELIKTTINNLTDYTYRFLCIFVDMEGIEKNIKPAVFMENVVNNYIVNLIFQASEGDINKIKKDFKDFTDRLIIFFESVAPMIEKNLNEIKNKEMH